MPGIPLTTPEAVRSSFLMGQGENAAIDNFLRMVIAGLSGDGNINQLSGFEEACGRVFVRGTYTRYYSSDGNVTTYPLPAYPIVSASVFVDTARVWGVETQLTADQYEIDRNGLPLLYAYPSPFAPGFQHIKVTWEGGLITSTDTVPSALALACAMQAAFVYQSRQRLGVSGESVIGSNATWFSPQTYLPAVHELLAPFRSML